MHPPHHTWTRRRGKSLELPVHRWIRSSDGAAVTVIGMIHIAEPEFYAAVREHIADIPNAKVLFEGINRTTDAELLELPRKEQAAIQTMRRRADGRTRWLVEATGLTSQKEALIPQVEGWHRSADMTDVQLMRAVGLVENPNALGPDMGKLLALPGFFHRLFGRFVRMVLCSTDVFTWDVVETALDKKVREVIEGHRNALAISIALEEVQTARVVGVLPWGARHVTGMGDMLAAQGFELVGVDWIPAVYAKRRKS